MAPAAITTPRTESFGQRSLALIPGLLLLAAVGYAGKFIELRSGLARVFEGRSCFVNAT